MSVPSHGPFCRTQTFDWQCPFCQSEIVVLKCTCGSHVWFSDGWPSWTRHHCDGTRDGIRRLGPGNSRLVGWTAVNVLRKIGIEIDPDIWDKLFPEDGRTSAEPAPHILRVAPDRRTQKRTLAVVRDLHSKTAAMSKALDELSTIGYQLAGLDPKARYQQVTLVDNSVRPNESYTALVPGPLVKTLRLGKLVAAELTGLSLGSLSVWRLDSAVLIGE